MAFIIANILLFIFYIVCFSKHTSSITAGNNEQFDKWMRAFTGISFLVLGVSILKYGSQLETTVTHSINLKSSMAAQMEGLDVRILSITILLSLVFLSRALVDCMFAFNLINEQLNGFVMLLCIIIFSEACTSVAIVRLMKKGSKTTDPVRDEAQDNHFIRAPQPNGHQSGRKSATKGISYSGPDNHHMNSRTGDGTGPSSKENLNESFTSYGSFNPNLDSGTKGLLTPAQETAVERRENSVGKKERGPDSFNYRQFVAAYEHLESAEEKANKQD